MNPFVYARADKPADAVAGVAAGPKAKFLGGGTNLLDLMKDGVETPDKLVDVNPLPLAAIEGLPGGGLRLGALARNTDVANHKLVRERYPVLAEALLAGATQQLRNMATVGGNLLQRTRCPYFVDISAACNKRSPGSGCDAIGGFNRSNAVLGVSDKCIATHASDMCVALAALDAVVRTRGPAGERSIPFADFYLVPGDTPERETVLAHGELIVGVDLPALPMAAKSHYLKVRDRASYAFALVSVAAALEVAGGKIRSARVALGGVATKPWRAIEAEKVLVGQPVGPDVYKLAAEAAMAGAKPAAHNAFKIELAKRTLVRALETVAAMA